MIEFNQLSLGYKQTTLVRDINFKIPAHCCTGIFGANGTGKSTLFFTMLGLIAPLSGNVKIFGQDPQMARSICSLMPQQDPSEALFHHQLSVLEILKIATITKNSWGLPFVTHQQQQDITNLLDKMLSLHLLNEPYNNLSGGQRQVVRLVQAMLPHPKVLLLDEPFTGLDKQAVKNLVHLIAEIKKDYTILIISHDLAPLKPILDNGILFYDKTYIANDLTAIEHKIDPHDECNR